MGKIPTGQKIASSTSCRGSSSRLPESFVLTSVRVQLASLPAAALPTEQRVLDFGKLPSTSSGPERVEGGRAAHRGWAEELSGHAEHPAWLSHKPTWVWVEEGQRVCPQAAKTHTIAL